MKKFLAFFTTFFAGGLAIEVLEYHYVATIQKDRWAEAPQLSAVFFMLAGLLMLARPKRASVALFAVACVASIYIGIAGVVFHFSNHSLAAATFGTASSWLGDPPPLAPLEFAVVGLLGLVTLISARDEMPGSLQSSGAASALYGIGTLVGLGALLLTALRNQPAAALAVAAAMVIGVFAYLVSALARSSERIV